MTKPSVWTSATAKFEFFPGSERDLWEDEDIIERLVELLDDPAIFTHDNVMVASTGYVFSFTVGEEVLRQQNPVDPLLWFQQHVARALAELGIEGNVTSYWETTSMTLPTPS